MQSRHKQPWQNESSDDEDSDYDNNEPVQMNFLEDIKGHLDGEISFETSVHDIYDPAFSQSISHRIKDRQDSAFKKFKQNNQSNKSTKSETSINIICSIDSYCQYIEVASSQSLPDVQQVKKKQQINFLYEQILSNKKTTKK